MGGITIGLYGQKPAFDNFLRKNKHGRRNFKQRQWLEQFQSGLGRFRIACPGFIKDNLRCKQFMITTTGFPPIAAWSAGGPFAQGRERGEIPDNLELLFQQRFSQLVNSKSQFCAAQAANFDSVCYRFLKLSPLRASASPREICSGCLKLNAYKLKTSSPSPEPEKRQELIANSIPC